MSRKLEGQLALITGATQGIGAAVAERFAQEGANLILIGRSVQRLEEVDDKVKAHGVESTLVPLDLKDYDKIDEIAAAVAHRFSTLDILVANAGVLGRLGPLNHLTPELWEEVIAVNLTANWHLIRAFDPLLSKAVAGRAIFVTSGAAQKFTPYWAPYACSKIALETMVRTYAQEIKNICPNYKVNLIDPGVVRTDMRAAAMPGEDPQSIPAPEDITDTFVELASAECTHHGEIIKAVVADQMSDDGNPKSELQT